MRVVLAGPRPVAGAARQVEPPVHCCRRHDCAPFAQRLRQLERDGLVSRTYHAEVPPRVEYEATPLAKTLTPVFSSIVQWSSEHLGEVLVARAAYDAGKSAN
ncbi:helix-turn-helix domain-containing protein [Nocardia sp. NPDC051787]|uniref:winged helix-turn-helix transcriptional regulator n=1 Tax=Nocardia sp. NPDC051787 TaxID=3155415 RepID=UPI0034496D1E